MSENTDIPKEDTRNRALKAADAVIDNLTNPTNAFAAANWTAVAGDPSSAVIDNVVAGIALAMTTVGTTKDSLNDAPISTPFYALSGVNYTLATMMLVREAQNGFANGGTLMLAISLAGWATGHLLIARQIQNDTKPKGVVDNANTYYGVSDITATHVSPPPGGINIAAVILGGAGLARTFFEKALPEAINKHITPPRLYAASYTAGAIGTALNTAGSTVTMNPNMEEMQLMAAWAYANFDSGFNRRAKNIVRRITGNPILPPPETLTEPSTLD